MGNVVKITRRQLRRIIVEQLNSVLEEQDCEDTEKGCIRYDDTGDDKGWYILNNKKGGRFREKLKSKKSAQSILRNPSVH